MSIVIDYTKGFFEASPAGESVGTVSYTGSFPNNVITLYLDTGNVFSWQENTGFQDIAFVNPPANGTAYGFTLRLTNGSGSWAYNWPASVKWPGGLAPDAVSANGTDVYVFYTQDGGTTYYGFVAGEEMA